MRARSPSRANLLPSMLLSNWRLGTGTQHNILAVWRYVILCHDVPPRHGRAMCYAAMRRYVQLSAKATSRGNMFACCRICVSHASMQYAMRCVRQVQSCELRPAASAPVGMWVLGRDSMASDCVYHFGRLALVGQDGKRMCLIQRPSPKPPAGGGTLGGVVLQTLVIALVGGGFNGAAKFNTANTRAYLTHRPGGWWV
eukprot:9480674-Pyramimonas_sp.AAC.1